ncbi:MAG: nitroreductase family protein [Anaerolineales bacterium]
MKVSEAIKYKRAVRNFRDEPLSADVINTILNAGRRSQSSKNSQPWDFIVITHKDRLEKLSKLGTYAGHLAGAALAVVIITPDPGLKTSIMFDAGQAAAYMQLAAWELGVGSCLATIYKTNEARLLLDLPDDRYVNLALSFGYPADRSVLTSTPEKGGRKQLADFVHWESW